MNYVYGLKDPSTGLVRYVGSTNNLKRRFSQQMHGLSNSTLFSEWRNTLQAQGLEPIIVILEECETRAEAYGQESYWIQMLTKVGCPLINNIWRPPNRKCTRCGYQWFSRAERMTSCNGCKAYYRTIAI